MSCQGPISIFLGFFIVILLVVTIGGVCCWPDEAILRVIMRWCANSRQGTDSQMICRDEFGAEKSAVLSVACILWLSVDITFDQSHISIATIVWQELVKVSRLMVPRGLCVERGSL